MRDEPLRAIRRLGRIAGQVLPAPRAVVPEGARTGQPQGLGVEPVHAKAHPSTTYARVKVKRHRTPHGAPEAFGFEAYCPGVPPLEYCSGEGQRRPQAISLRSARQGGEPPSELLRSIRRWSGHQRPLTDWINRCRAAHRDALQIVFLDQTGFDLPWEALTLPAVTETGLAGGLLGALVDIARWLDVRHGRDDFPADAAAPAGGVLGYFHHDMRSDMTVFEGYDHRPHTGIVSFLNSLDAHDTDRTGLVYMGCHGTFADQLSKLTLADVTWAEYSDQEMTLLRRDGSLVCLNACHSGGLLDYDGDGRQYLRGFTEIFLGKGAGGCIVTAGKIGEAEAGDLIRHLVEAVTADPARPVARALRAFRARALAEFEAGGGNPLQAGGGIPLQVRDDGTFDARGQRHVLRLLYSLMFQYYGHPLSTLHLTGPHEHGAREREGASP
ncbi:MULTISPECIES: CHAT domain-containing protein [unclassified Streptomyces]|uniref:CHAT domain-containing protein n=1 Tax=unclassified Streptomyces TaxID=2593676 RepID=UPI0022529BCE|nr:MULTISPECIES: CHAT domain-containing protein [unclassified Streptomyces]WSP57474.1 CHAT domain-containing protein [Streptomyces sp. NBC_01241]WSU21789.1 CHAT domain-containing protein [Streptomyces sp. NBC_01108]WTA38075.1 CHAT domain-containing protein [Streptomyces sp. NBC_00846]MCX4789326.1 CHAT domain-containing protein [Streptomyces sp. NBC_01221]MCX4794946.1 CHAT domain-containing protein [Streptomyces sp. NBC_01242]